MFYPHTQGSAQRQQIALQEQQQYLQHKYGGGFPPSMEHQQQQAAMMGQLSQSPQRPLPPFQPVGQGPLGPFLPAGPSEPERQPTAAGSQPLKSLPFPPASQSKAPQTKLGLDMRLLLLIPPVLPKEMLEDMERHSVEVLCSIGREIVHDLMSRALNLASLLNMNVTNAKKSAALDVETILHYCKTLFTKLAEVRLRIDQKLSSESRVELSDDELFRLFSKPDPPTVNPRKQELLEEFERNRAEILSKSIHLKKLEWLSNLEDPRFARKAMESLQERK